MAVKEVTIKVVVEGQQIELSGKQVELFKQNIIQLKQQLAELGERTEENGELFDKLSGDLQSLEKTFGEVKEESKGAGDGIKDTGDKSEKSGEKVKSLRAQLAEARNELAALGPRTAENAVRFDELTTRVQGLSEQYEDLQFGTKKLDDALAAIPGPIGQAAQGFKMFDDTMKNVKSAFGTLGREFKGFGDNLKNFKIGDLKNSFKNLLPSLDGMKTGLLNIGKAIIASGVGAFVVILGLLAAALIKSLASMKPIQDAVGRLGTLFEVLMDAVKPVADFIANALVSAMDFLGKTIAFLTGNLDEYNKKLADKKATQDAADNLAKQQRDFEMNAYKYDEFTQRKMKADLDYNAKKAELNQMFLDGEIKTQAELNKLLKDASDKRNYEIDQADKDRQKKTDEDAKAAADKARQEAERRAQIEKDYQNKLKAIKDENTLLAIKDENDRAKKQLEIQLENQLKEIDGLKVSDAKKLELKKQTNKKFELLEKQRQEKVIADQKKADEDILKTIRDGETAREENEFRRREKEAENRKNDALKALQESKASEEAIAKAKLEIERQYQADKDKIKQDEARKARETAKKIFDIETETALANIENRLMMVDMSTADEVTKIQERNKILAQQRQLNFNKEISDLKVLLENKEITQDQFNEKERIKIETFNLQKKQFEIQTEEQIRQAKLQIKLKALDDIIQIAGQESDVGKAALVAKQVLIAKELFLEMKRTLTFAKGTFFRSKAAAAEGFAQTGKVGFPQNIPLLIAYAAQAASILSAVISATKGAENMGGETTAVAGTIRNMEKGGMIGGKRHAQGGTLIEAEQGEAIMTRGAVTQFRDVLSAMNTMGGGTSFNRNALMTSFDAPIVDKPAETQEPIIMKTYVVSNELTTEAEKQARLKELSTL